MCINSDIGTMNQNQMISMSSVWIESKNERKKKNGNSFELERYHLLSDYDWLWICSDWIGYVLKWIIFSVSFSFEMYLIYFSGDILTSFRYITSLRMRSGMERESFLKGFRSLGHSVTSELLNWIIVIGFNRICIC